MPYTKILPDSRDPAKPKHVPKSDSLVAKVPRFQPGGKDNLKIAQSFNRQNGKKGKQF